jgi:hypothetical protein
MELRPTTQDWAPLRAPALPATRMVFGIAGTTLSKGAPGDSSVWGVGRVTTAAVGGPVSPPWYCGRVPGISHKTVSDVLSRHQYTHGGVGGGGIPEPGRAAILAAHSAKREPTATRLAEVKHPAMLVTKLVTKLEAFSNWIFLDFRIMLAHDALRVFAGLCQLLVLHGRSL